MRPSEWSDERLSAEFAFKNGPVRGRYFKIHLTDIYFSATLFDFYEVHEPGLEAEPLRFKPMEVGQPVEALPIELVNTSKAEVTIESVTVDSDVFVVTKGDSAVAPARGPIRAGRFLRLRASRPARMRPWRR